MTSSFSLHLDQCYGNSISIREKTLPDSSNKENIHITVSQTIVK
jgi:hypothetical protein